MKLVFIVVGLLATILAFLGAILPGLPTTPFLLVALWAFARSSPRLHNWLLTVPLLQTALTEAQRFEQEGTMRLAVKLVALAAAWGSAALMLILNNGKFTTLTVIVALSALAATLVTILVPTSQNNSKP